MVNNEAFAKRLQYVIEYYGESASSFAEKIGVQRSSISHILSGRNKPSLEFVLKVLSSFPEVEIYWLLNGKGAFPSLGKPDVLEKSETQTSGSKPDPNTYTSNNKSIERIVVFYSDGSFKSYEN
ncbi:helix-turn-helix domain-containing protein [Snuella sedimenti]|uniref:Helix-turn-helix transcriptional regulator n=1 Tax=Snuella sedimenti TaxID=2798802 RepID=A0A8J7LND4_9FLAO|nr:helix-turn-helix transcriptional regulator [Snuella sedimenti]MBJ6368649.1 helix-turn-helix transcriptional regulator [Snuella sedimenti]